MDTPEWAKKAAEEIAAWCKSTETRKPNYIAAIITKHAPKVMDDPR